MNRDQTESTKAIYVYSAVVLVFALAVGMAAYWFEGSLRFIEPDQAGQWLNAFWGRFQVMFILAVLIERSVETYLNATRQNGRAYFDAEQGIVLTIKDAKQSAMTAALVLSVLVALSGVRIIETLVTLQVGAGFWKSALWYGIDIMVSAGLMAGGADLFHKLATVITSGLTRVRANLRAESVDGAPAPRVDVETLRALQSARAYTITISRPTNTDAEKGTLEFKDGSVTINTDCWWDKTNRIDAGTYERCSKTYMATLGIEGIYLPDAVSRTTGAKEIFIHRGAGPANSRGCIVVDAGNFNRIWSHITPLNGRNVTVVVKDV